LQSIVQSGILPNAHERLAEIPTLQHGLEGLGGLCQPGPEIFFVLHFAVPDPASHLVKKVGLVLIDKIPYMQTVYLDVLALEGWGTLGHPGVMRIALSRRAILGDEPTETDARLPIE
jgi:hypothetical protein